MGQTEVAQFSRELEFNSSPEMKEKLDSRALVEGVMSQMESVTVQTVQTHLSRYLALWRGSGVSRRRSYELLEQERGLIGDKDKSNRWKEECEHLVAQMEWLEEVEEQIRNNITELMATQKTYKIRQTFRGLMLDLLKVNNLMVFLSHRSGRIQFQDFRSNYITDILDSTKSLELQKAMALSGTQRDIPLVASLFGLSSDNLHEEGALYRWDSIQVNDQISMCYCWKSLSSEQEVVALDTKLMAKVATICLISTSEAEHSIVDSYAKDLLDILEHLINQCQAAVCTRVNTQFSSLQQLEKWLRMKEGIGQFDCEELLAHISAFQQLQFELLERIRMYKKYACEESTVFMEFDEKAELTFISNNFPHRFCSDLPKLQQKNRLYIENIFKQHTCLSDFLRRAIARKVKPHKLYELDFETRARVIYDQQQKIKRLHVIITDLDTESSGSGHIYSSRSSDIYRSSSATTMSDSDSKTSQKAIGGREGRIRNSVLIRQLQKEAPGIANQGWINLFIKDEHFQRQPNHYQKRKLYSLKRSHSLDKSSDLYQEEDDSLAHLSLDSPDLNLLELRVDELQPFVGKVMKKLEWFRQENIAMQSWENFVSDVQNGYQTHNNPFHNFTHGVNVMHTCYLLANSPRAREALTPFQIFTVVFSGLCHDLGHTGFTNLFQIASRSKKAITYNDLSPLQNYHASSTFELLRKPENNFFKNLTPQEEKTFRKSVISNILFTDIKEHFPLLKKFDQIIKDEMPRGEDYTNTLTAMILHTADFGGSAKEFEICKEWSLKVNLEFSNQYKREGELGLPQTPFMKDLTNLSVLSKNEGGFLKVIVLPLYEAIDSFAGVDFRTRKMRQAIENNIKSWQLINKEFSDQKQEKK